MDYQLVTKDKHIDERGFLAEFLTKEELRTGTEFGHIYFVTFLKPGMIRGNHYHLRKREFLGLATGKVEIVIEDIETKERKTFIFDGTSNKFTCLQIGPKIAHAVKSLAENTVLIDYFDSPYDQENPDSFSYKLLNESK